MSYSTTYKNNQRIVSGSVPIFNDDVVLLCDTSSIATTMTLNAIAANYWNTTWKLYVVDNSNNASVNNITINAGAGQTINGASSVTIASNGGQFLIRVSSNNTFIAESNSGNGGLANLSVEQNGAFVVGGVNILNFIGSAVSVSTPSSGQANVTINANGYLILSSAALLALIAAGTLNIGWTYIVNNVSNANTFVAVQAIANNAVQNYGAGYFLNADYQNVGNYSGVSGFTSQKGIWLSGASYSAGDVVLWNNYHWKNLAGANTTSPNTDPSNWSQLSKSITNGYIIEVDFVIYDVANNLVKMRYDSRNNEVEYTTNSFENFQWGKNTVSYNKVLNNAVMNSVNSPCVFNYNVLINGSSITDATPSNITNGVYSYNELNDSQITVTSCNITISQNILSSSSYITIGTAIGESTITGNNISQGSYININTIQSGTQLNYNNLIETSYIKDTGSTTLSQCLINANNIRSTSYIQLNVSCTKNNIYESEISGRSYILCTGSYTGNTRNNILSVNSYLTLNTGAVNVDCSGNIISQFSYITIGSNLGQVDSNVVNDSSNIQITTNQSGSYISLNNLQHNSSLTVATGATLARIRYNNLQISTLAITQTNTNLENNTLNLGIVTIGTLTALFSNNIFNNNANVTITSSNYSFTGCEVSDNATVSFGALSSSFADKKYKKGYSNWEFSLDLSNGSIFSGTTLTIPTSYFFVGIFDLLNATSKTISSIINAPTNHQFNVRPSSVSLPNSVTIAPITIGSTAANNVIASDSSKYGGSLYTARVNGGDEGIFGAYGNLIGLIIKNTWT
jgi:hypothetical protein